MSDQERRRAADSVQMRESLRKLLRGAPLEALNRDLPQSPYGQEVPPEKQERIDRSVLAACIVLGGLTAAWLAYGLAAHDFFVHFSFWKAAALTLVTGLGSLCAGVTLGAACGFLVLPAVRGLLVLTWPRYRLAFRNQHHVLAQKSLYSLFAVNAYIAAVALFQQWDLEVLLWIYWFQSVFVGLYCTFVLGALQDPGRGAPFLRRLGHWAWTLLLFVVLYGVLLGYLAEALIRIEPHPPRPVFFFSGLVFLEMLWSFYSDRDLWRTALATVGEDKVFRHLFTLPFCRLIPLLGVLLLMDTVYTKHLFPGTQGLAAFMALKIVTDQAIHARQLRTIQPLSGGL